ncbi:hypothetical protein ACSNOJ_13770 [Streptomyces sp. URMC 128]|uniref:hypothetical protein n=1 Tax=Streptomyces sp. URMC 128 TaxID=3423404 RepID=UPI003F1D98CD
MTAVGAAPLLPAVLPAAEAAASARPDFPLLRNGTPTDVFVDAADDPAVVRAAGDLVADVERVGGVRPRLLHAVPRRAGLLVLVGTLGASRSCPARRSPRAIGGMHGLATSRRAWRS